MQRSFSSSVKQHLLLSYNQSFAAVLRAQHAGKGLRWATLRDTRLVAVTVAKTVTTGGGFPLCPSCAS